MMDALCAQYKIFTHNSVLYRPKLNGTVDTANENVKKILQQQTITYRGSHENFPFPACMEDFNQNVNRCNSVHFFFLFLGMEVLLK